MNWIIAKRNIRCWILAIVLYSGIAAANESTYNGSSNRSDRATKTSSYFGGGSSHGLCDTPTAPKNGGLSCNTYSRRMYCTATCLIGFRFPDGSEQKKHSCSNHDGDWLPESRFPDCEPVCDPPCQNGGQCYGQDRCVCTPIYRGDKCEYAVANCDGNQFHQTGNWGCNHTNEQSMCTISCPLGMQFEYPPSNAYICDLQGNWLPKQAPKCISMNVVIHPIHPILPATLEPLVVTKVIEKRKSVCATWGQLHYRTFDGSMFSIQGKCTYLLMRDCASDSFSIHVKNYPQCIGAYNCSRSVIIYINSNKYILEKTIKGPTIFWGLNRLKIPTTINGLLIEEVASYIVVQSGLGFTVRWNGQDVVMLEADVELFNKTCGLCGRFDGKDSNDFEMADGTTTTNIATLVNSWKMSDIGDSCADASKLEHTCRYDSFENQRLSDQADEICSRLMSPEYSVCHILLDPKPYFEMCRLDFCACGMDNEQCACSSLAVYFQEFHRLGGKLPRGWRKPDFCNLECRGDMVYQDCGSSCPKTCKKALQECSNEQCVDGCHCPKGTVLHNHQCIDEHQCPCFYSGKTYASGQSIQQDCNACICQDGAWQCTHEKCEARCSSVGDPHYTTFDGKRYDFMGKCSYYLMYGDNYTIEQENVACSGAISENMGFIVSPGADYPSCTKSVTIRLPETVVQLKQRREITVDGKDVTTLPFLENGIHVYSISSLFVKVELLNGLSIIWDGASRVYIDAPTTFLSKTKGLCGTYNYNQKDDFLTGEGDVEQNIGAFANKWKISESCQDMALSDKLTDPCEVFSQRKDKAQSLCGRLKSEIFSACHDVIDPEPFFRDCMYDMCYCQTKVENCLCPAISDYAVECAKKGSPVEWRSNVRQCGLNCHGGQVYQVCGSSCKRSCTDISYHTKCREQCVEGCNCPLGMTLNADGECIPISSCPCIYGNKNFIAGHMDFRGNLACECTNARWECRPATENELSSSHSEKLQEMPKCSAAANMEYTDCASDCPKTCKNMHQHTNCESSYCKPGCSCMKGYVLDTKTSHCVKPTQCPCHHGGQSYGETETIQEDCNTCVCEGGAWKCESKECPGICTAFGESHFKSFDGRMFEFQGDCDYILAKGGEDKSDRFLVTIHNVPCGSSDITCTKSITFNIGDDKVTLASEKPLPKSKYSTRYLIREVGLYVFIHTDIGITLQWDKGTRVYIKADARWKNGLAGLCGNFNGDENDDFKTSDGGLPVAKSTVFGDSWRLRDYCPESKQINNTCDLHPNRKSWAMRQCSILKSTLFRPCHSEVPYEPYLERCVFDSCGCDMGGDCHCLCTALATYAQECNSQGVEIQWRSQELCPIQCETCAKYTPCMSVCPSKTCETQFLYSRIEDSCGQELCVEGCEPKPCPVGEIFNNDKEFKCIPIASCGAKVQQCKQINGHMYNEGERIHDPKVADMCQSCFCRGGDIVCLGKKCTEVTQKPVTSTRPSTTPVTTVSQISPCMDGWSEWINVFSPTFKNGGDYETFELFKKRHVTICPLDNARNIQCRTAATHKPYRETGQNVWCSLSEGLVCENKDQPSVKLCFDYEVRIYCECTSVILTGEEATPVAPTEIIEETTTEAAEIPPKAIECTAPGWTEWMNSKEPSNNGEYEILPDLRKQYTFCSENEITEIECRTVTGKYRVIRQTISTDVECTKDRGLVCLNSDSKMCPDYEVRFYCRCSETDCAYPRGMETGSIDDQHISVSSFKTPMSLGHKARLNGKAAWIAGTNDENQWIEIDLSEIQEVTGLDTQGNPNSNEWVSAYRVMYSNDGRQWESIKNSNDFDQIFAGNADKNTAVRHMFEAPINARFIRVMPIEWETGISLRLEVLGCNRIVTAIPTTQPPTTQVETASASPSTTPSPITTPTTRGTAFPYLCVDGWTEWMNMDSPETNHHYEILTGNIGDVEPIDELRYFYSFCANPVTVECRAAHTKKLAHLTGQKIKCDLDGVMCINDKQDDGQCLNYEIRFYCECGEKTSTTPVAPTTGSTNTPGTEHCTDNEWTEWMNSNNPKQNQDGDIETYNSLRSKYSFCATDYIVNIECRVAGKEISYSEAGQYGVVCDLNHGLQCLHSMQASAGGECKDYEVRLYCLCQEIVTSIFTPTATQETKSIESIKELIVTSRYETTEMPNVVCNAWTEWMNNDNPHDDGNDSELLRNIPNFDQMCPKPVSFQCRDAYSWDNYRKTGQNFKERCNANGIVCESKGQKCLDYEIRVFCLCPTPPPEATCQPGWTQWFDTDDPSIGEGDFEQIDDIRQKYDLCPTELISDIQCQARSYSVGPKQMGRLQGKGGTGHSGSSKVGSRRPIGKTGGRIARQIKIPGKTETKFGGWLDYTETGDVGVKCSKATGLACYNDFQKKKCRDYRVRFYCSCAKPTLKPWPTARTTKWIQESTIATSTTPQPTSPPVTPIPDVCGWTPWLNADNPEANSGSDFETIEKLQDIYNLCEKSVIKDIECRIADSKIPWDKSGQNGLTCDTENGFRCDNSIQHRGCYDYEVRVACIPEWCEGTTRAPPTEIIATVVTTPPCEPGQTWSDCAYRCDSMCQSFQLQAINSDLCNVTTACLPGCISIYCEPPNVWRDEATCVKPEECTCMLEDGQIVPPGEIFDMDDCEQCQCITNTLHCAERQGCRHEQTTEIQQFNVTVTPYIATESSTELEIIKPAVVPYIVQEDCWTEWINIGSPDNIKLGDREDLATIRTYYSFCDEPIAIECREVENDQQAQRREKQDFTCDVKSGLVCWNQKNYKTAGCYDYEVRFFCPCASSTVPVSTTEEVTTTGWSERTHEICTPGFTNWFNSHQPNDVGEYENIQSIRQAGYEFCDNHYITAMECRVTESGIPHHKSNDQAVTCDFLGGLYCENNNQRENRKCMDYEVRFFCDCGFIGASSEPTTEPTTTATEQPTTTPAEISITATETPLLITSPLPCSYWSDWINNDKPLLGKGDVEYNHMTDFCKDGEVEDIQCVLAESGISYTETTGRGLICSVEQGFICKNKIQPAKMCNDYKIRYYCGCVTTTPTTMSPTTPSTVITTGYTTIIIVPAPPPPSTIPCEEYFYFINSEFTPLPDSQLQASSSLNALSGPQSGRLQATSSPTSAGAWVPQHKSTDQYIQVDLMKPRIIYGVAIQGHFSLQSWVTSFEVIFSKDGIAFSYAMNPDGSIKIFKGNYDNNDIVTNIFETPFEARYVRVIPKSWKNDIALRFDLLGCSEFKTTTMPTTTAEGQKCDEPMGLESGLLSNQQMKASSYYDETQSPHKARLNSENNWSPHLSNNQQYLEIDFIEPRVISGIATQGNAGAPQWVTSYVLSYSNDELTWTAVEDDSGNQKVFAGNFDGTTVVTNYLDQPTRMRYLRIIPQTWHNWIAIRMEIKGCYEPYTTPAELLTSTFISTEVPEITTQEEKQVECTDYMNEKLPENQIEVSSSQAGIRSGAKRLALNTLEEEDTGGWVAGQSNSKQFVLIDYGSPLHLTGIVTQGRNKHPEWVTDYKVLYSNDKINWHTAYDQMGNSVFPGNEDRDTPVQHLFSPAIAARYLKVVPTKWKDWISMRLEILGCPLTKGTPSELFHSTVVTTTIPETTMPELPPECTEYMNKDLLENQIEISSSLAGDQSGAKRLALNTLEKQDTGGWVAGQSNSKQFVQIDYGKPLKLTGIVTQGRNKHPEWVTAYKVLHSNDKQNWLPAHDELGNTVFPGNEDSNTPVQHLFSITITAQYLKIVPIKWKDWISMRLEILGCPPTEEASTKEQCYSYGPWLSLHMPIPGSLGDIEPIDEIISKSKLCISPAKIECRETTSRALFDKFNQMVTCDLSQGLTCLDDQQKSGHKCYNYEVRIACWTCEVTTEPPVTTLPPVALCPEISASMGSSCPNSCPHGLVCDGQQCVDPITCVCVRDGKVFKPGERIETKDCEECTCGLQGYSYCVNKTCPICHYGLEGTPNDHCQCECKTCPKGEILCPTNQFCLAEHLWCDGIVDCPDDERDCRHTTTLAIVTEVPTRCPPQPIPKCQSDEELVLQNPSESCPTYACSPILQNETATPPTTPIPIPTIQNFCEMNSNYFKTFDGFGYQYDICQHIIVQDKENKKFNITVVKSCQKGTTQCTRSLIITQDDQRIEVSQDLDVTYNNIKYTDAQLTKLSRRFTELTAKIIGDSVIINSPKYGYEVSWNSEGNARFGVTSDLVNKIHGLCGYFSLTQDDDKTTPDGKTVSSVTEFGDSWSVGPQENCTPLSCPAEVLAEAIAACNELRRAPFDSCSDIVDPNYHIQVCIASICECLTNTNHTDKECRCKAYLPYVEACEMKNVAKIRYWRVKQSCLPNCPPGLVWQDCGLACERTCGNLHDYNIGNVTCNSDQCVSGCFCPVGLVRKGDHCVQPEKCQDCVCKGYGDPHYFTYDGLYFPFQGNCTYVLSQDIVRPNEPHKFQVYATNEDCFEEPLTTCTVAIMILFNDHIAHFRVNESVTFDGVQLYLSDLPFHKYGIHIESIPGRSVTFSVPEVFLEVRYFELNYGFEVRIPSEIYYNKTEGLCGNCNFNNSDDMCCQNGTVTNNTDEFGFSWIAVPPEGFESVNEVCKLKEDTGCKPTIEEEKCDRILAEEFTPCHALVDPTMYLASCRFDTCRSINPTASICRAVMEYARKCAEFGVCIQNWRTDDFCPYECPPGMYFDQCGPKCPKSCKDIAPNGWAPEEVMPPQSREGKDIIPDWRAWSQKQTLLELDDICDSTPVDGCFCTGGKVLKDGECVDPILCEICDDANHKVGETWQPNPCTSCTCTMSLRVKCTTTECPQKPTCTTEETLKVTVRDNMTCCDKYDCVPKVIQPTCEDVQMPECKSGEIVKIDWNTSNGCLKYVCECDATLCPPLQVPPQLEIGEETAIIKTGCCPIMETVCKPENCPAKPICSKDHEMKERPNPKSRCCAEFYCEPPPDVCMYTHQYEVVDGQEIQLKSDAFITKAHKSGEAWMDGLCRKCTCEAGHGQYRHRCTVEICPQLEDYQDNADYNWKKEPQPGLCCSKFIRTGCVVNGKNYNIGEHWASPDGDKCKTYRCSILPSGEAIRVERQTTCIKDCDLGAVYVNPPVSSSDCCGKCEPNACVEDGKLYNVGDTWNSTLQKCFSAECLKNDEIIRMRFIGKACSPVPVGCTKKIKDSEGCCDICNSTTESESQLSAECKPERIKPKETIGMFNLFENHAKCTNKKPILNMKACIGSCKSSSVYSADQHGFSSSCECCTPTKMEKRTLLLECTDGKKRPIEYSQPIECACNGNCGSGEDQSEKQIGKLKATIY